MQLRHDHTDTWSDGAEAFTEPLSDRLSGGTWVVEESGPLRASVRMEHRLGTSRLRWTLGLHRGDKRLHMRLEINFDAQYGLLQLALRLAQPPLRRTDAIPGGAIARPFSPVECPVQGWSRLGGANAELALLTQDAFSVSADGAAWQWTLLRSPRMAWQGSDPPFYHGRNTHTDQGTHDFAFVLQVGETLPDAALHTLARRLAQPLITFDRTEGIARPLPERRGGRRRLARGRLAWGRVAWGRVALAPVNGAVKAGAGRRP